MIIIVYLILMMYRIFYYNEVNNPTEYIMRVIIIIKFKYQIFISSYSSLLIRELLIKHVGINIFSKL